MMHSRFAAVLLAAVLFAAPANAQDRPSSVRLFLDCDRKLCDLEFIRSEITLVDFVRDRTDSDVHLLITSEGTGSGGRVFDLTFIGRRDFVSLSDTLSFTSNGNDSDDIRRR